MKARVQRSAVFSDLKGLKNMTNTYLFSDKSDTIDFRKSPDEEASF